MTHAGNLRRIQISDIGSDWILWIPPNFIKDDDYLPCIPYLKPTRAIGQLPVCRYTDSSQPATCQSPHIVLSRISKIMALLEK